MGLGSKNGDKSSVVDGMPLILIRRHASILVEMEKNAHAQSNRLFPLLQLFFSQSVSQENDKFAGL